jgi:hypothetical protein
MNHLCELTHEIGEDGRADQHGRNGKEPLERRRRDDVTIPNGAQSGERPVQGGDVLGEVALVQQAFLERYRGIRVSQKHDVQKLELMTSLKYAHYGGGDVLGEVGLLQQAFLERYRGIRFSEAHDV